MLSPVDSGHLFTLDPRRAYPRIVRAEGVYLWDSAGNQYLDAAAGIAVANIGYGRDEVVAAMAQQASRLPFAAPNIFVNDPAIRLANALAEMTPGDLNWVHFASGGSEAVEVAIKLARQYHYESGKPEKSVVISRWTSYHGASLGALSATGMPGRRKKFEPLLLDFPHIPPSYCYRCPWGRQYPTCEMACALDLERAIAEIGSERVAAFIAEPVVASAGGSIEPRPEYFRIVREICDRHDVLLIADEIVTGFGRTGYPFAVDRWSVVPDLLVMGKGMSGGYAPLAGVAVSEAVHDVFVEAGAAFDHIFTYSGHPVAAAAGLAALRILERENLVENVKQMEGELREALEDLREYPFVGDVRVCGFMAAVEFVQDRENATPFPRELNVAARVQLAGLRRGIVTYPGTGMADGTNGDVISLYPPLTFSSDNIAEAMFKLHETLSDVERELGAAGARGDRSWQA